MVLNALSTAATLGLYLLLGFCTAGSTSAPSMEGLTISGRTYPSEGQLSKMSLGDLVAIRPGDLRHPEEFEHFYSLFSKHPDVSKLDSSQTSREDLINGWTRIWTQEIDDSIARKFPHSIISYLRLDRGIDKSLREEIIRRSKSHKRMLTARKRRDRMRNSSDPREMRLRELELRYKREYQNIIRTQSEDAFAKKNAEDFKRMLIKEGIDTKSPAADIELLTRSYRELLGGAMMTSKKLRAFLKVRGEDPVSIESCMRARRAFNYRLGLNQVNEASKEIRRSLKEMLKTGRSRSRKQDKILLASLLTRSKWWTYESRGHP